MTIGKLIELIKELEELEEDTHSFDCDDSDCRDNKNRMEDIMSIQLKEVEWED